MKNDVYLNLNVLKDRILFFFISRASSDEKPSFETIIPETIYERQDG